MADQLNIEDVKAALREARSVLRATALTDDDDGIASEDQSALVAVRERVDAAIAGLDGMALLPREPTEAMVRAGQRAADDRLWVWRGQGMRPEGTGLDGMTTVVEHAYRAMITAAERSDNG